MTDLHEEYREELHQPYGGYNRSGCHNFIAPDVKLGLGAKVWHYSIILTGCDIGLGVSIGSRCEIGKHSIVGAHSRIGSGVFLPPNSVVGERVFIGPNVTCTDDRHPRVPTPDEVETWSYDARPPIIEDYASIGAGAVLLPGVRIGHHARVAAGAIVTRDVAPFGFVRGEPARGHDPSPATQAKWFDPAA